MFILLEDWQYWAIGSACGGFLLGWLGRSVLASREQDQRDAAQTAVLREEAERRAVAEMQAARLPDLLARLEQQQEALAAERSTVAGLQAQRAQLSERVEQERRAAADKLRLLDEAQTQLGAAFKALAAEALRGNNSQFLQLAQAQLGQFQQAAQSDLQARQQAVDALVKPLAESLDKMQGRIGDIELKREGAYQGLSEQVKSLLAAQETLRVETGGLVKALRQPATRGAWGEMQLKRAVELAGMLEHCDFDQQVSTENSEGQRRRPDAVVHLPGGKHIVIDAKTPLEAYLDALALEDEAARRSRLLDHARAIRQHIDALSRKAYWEQFSPAPEFVVLFIPGEAFYSTALQYDPALIEYGPANRVLVATPTTLIALLRAAAYGWRQQALEENARAISALGQELYKRIATLAGHWARMGKSLAGAVDAYNDAVGSMERSVLPQARRFKELGADGGTRDVEPLNPVDQSARPLAAPEWAGEADVGQDTLST
jgi:DNA recombination protein RmuC